MFIMVVDDNEEIKRNELQGKRRKRWNKLRVAMLPFSIYDGQPSPYLRPTTATSKSQKKNLFTKRLKTEKECELIRRLEQKYT